MNIKRLLTFGPPTGVAIGAGLAAALLFSLVGKMTLPALALASLAPLPIMIACLAFGRVIGAGATGGAALAIFGIVLAEHAPGGFGEAARASLIFAAALGLPAFWLCFLADQSRPQGRAAWSSTRPAGSSYLLEYCPLERILTSAVAISATLIVLAVLFISLRHGSFESALDQATIQLTAVLENMFGETPQLPVGYDFNSAARLLALATPALAAGAHLFILMLNLGIAGRVAQVSGRLHRPWPDVARELRIPRIYGVVLAVASTAAIAGGLPGLIASIIVAALGAAFAMQGLAVVHYLSRGSKSRAPLLFLVYGGLPVFLPWSLAPFTLIGLVEAAFSLRDRKTTVPPKNKD